MTITYHSERLRFIELIETLHLNGLFSVPPQQCGHQSSQFIIYKTVFINYAKQPPDWSLMIQCYRIMISGLKLQQKCRHSDMNTNALYLGMRLFILSYQGSSGCYQHPRETLTWSIHLLHFSNLFPVHTHRAFTGIGAQNLGVILDRESYYRDVQKLTSKLHGKRSLRP